jgi:hypothetical protein
VLRFGVIETSSSITATIYDSPPLSTPFRLDPADKTLNGGDVDNFRAPEIFIIMDIEVVMGNYIA